MQEYGAGVVEYPPKLAHPRTWTGGGDGVLGEAASEDAWNLKLKCLLAF